MKIFMLDVLLITFFILISSISNAQWQQTNGPYGGTIKCFSVSGTNIFAATDRSGVFLSTNNG